MYFALPSSLESLLPRSKKASEDVALPEFIDAFLKGLCVIGTPSTVLLGLRRHLRLLGSVSESATKGVSSLESLLRRHDLLMDGGARGFASLFASAIENDEVFSGDTIDFEGLHSCEKERLRPLGDAAAELLALNDLSDALSVNAQRSAACIVLYGIAEWRTEISVCGWLQEQAHLNSTLKLFNLKGHLDGVSAAFVQQALPREDLRDFSLWLLARMFAGHIKVEPLEKRLVNTMLKKAQLPSLATFERVGL